MTIFNGLFFSPFPILLFGWSKIGTQKCNNFISQHWISDYFIKLAKIFCTKTDCFLQHRGNSGMKICKSHDWLHSKLSQMVYKLFFMRLSYKQSVTLRFTKSLTFTQFSLFKNFENKGWRSCSCRSVEHPPKSVEGKNAYYYHLLMIVKLL